VEIPASPGRLPVRARRGLALALLPVAALPFLLSPAGPATAAPPASQTREELRERERQAAGDLEDSSAQVQAAGAALRAIEGQLPAARRRVAEAKGELAGARAKAAAALAAVQRAEQARQAAQRKVDAASDRVDEGREDVGRLARRTYQRGRLSGLRDVLEAGEPQDAVVRAGMLRSVFKSQNSSLSRLTKDRLSLARTQAELAADERALTKARQQAEQGAARARAVAVEAEQAAARVEGLAAQHAATLKEAENHRAQDLRDYAAAQAASRALAERIRAAAARAAAQRAAEARRAAAAAKRAAAAAEADRRRRERAGQPAAKPRKQSRPQSQPREGRMLWPAPGRLTSRYGYREHPIYGDRRFHAGIDIGGGRGARVSAADGGVVTYAGYAGGYGTLVVISHGLVGGRDLSTAYAHMGELTVREGQSVDRGDKVGEIGNEGNSTGPHLHFEVRVDGDPRDPLDYVDPP
jgi:murein DD-endopeptidase MepM/ murein hydrolase activator NlpD